MLAHRMMIGNKLMACAVTSATRCVCVCVRGVGEGGVSQLKAILDGFELQLGMRAAVQQQLNSYSSLSGI